MVREGMASYLSLTLIKVKVETPNKPRLFYPVHTLIPTPSALSNARFFFGPQA